MVYGYHVCYSEQLIHISSKYIITSFYTLANTWFNNLLAQYKILVTYQLSGDFAVPLINLHLINENYTNSLKGFAAIGNLNSLKMDVS